MKHETWERKVSREITVEETSKVISEILYKTDAKLMRDLAKLELFKPYANDELQKEHWLAAWGDVLQLWMNRMEG